MLLLFIISQNPRMKCTWAVDLHGLKINPQVKKLTTKTILFIDLEPGNACKCMSVTASMRDISNGRIMLVFYASH